MQYRDHEFRYDSDSEEIDAEAIRDQKNGKQYRAKRSAKLSRRRGTTKSSPSHPGCGMAGRRNRRWGW